eukprot:SM000124S25905  [mRNA]  locus=s124:39703:41389:+ [translate_table: standard]
MRCGEPAFAPARKWRRLDELLRSTKKITAPLHVTSHQQVVNHRPVTRYGGLSATAAEVADSGRPGKPSLQVSAGSAGQEVERPAVEPGGLASNVRAAAVKELQLLFNHKPTAQENHQPINSRGGGHANSPDAGGSPISKHRRDLVALQTCSCSRNLEIAGPCKVPRQGDTKIQGKACEGSGSVIEPDIVPLLFLRGGGVASPRLVSGLCLLGSPDARRDNDQLDNRGPPQANNAHCSCNWTYPDMHCVCAHRLGGGTIVAQSLHLISLRWQRAGQSRTRSEQQCPAQGSQSKRPPAAMAAGLSPLVRHPPHSSSPLLPPSLWAGSSGTAAGQGWPPVRCPEPTEEEAALTK